MIVDPDGCREEFERYVWAHTEDAFQQQFDVAVELTDAELRGFLEFVEGLAKGKPEKDLAVIIRHSVALYGKSSLARFIQLSGLTRSKIITDLKSLRASGVLKGTVPGTYAGLPRSKVWVEASSELAARLRPVLGRLGGLPPEWWEPAIRAIGQATWPGYIRQERAKRQGHEGERRLAKVFLDLEIPFEPREKAENPLGRDAQVKGVSFDLVSPTVEDPLLLVKSTVHTANIGQFGESKDALEMAEARGMIDAWDDGRRPLLVALADGIGFFSNREGLNGVFRAADHFLQFRTLWKAPLIAAGLLNRGDLSLYLPDEDWEFFQPFLEEVHFDSERRLREPPPNGIRAGDGTFAAPR